MADNDPLAPAGAPAGAPSGAPSGAMAGESPVAGTAAGWRNVWTLPISTAIVVTAIYTWQRVLPLILREEGANDFEVSLSFTLMALAASLPQLLGGLVADRAGRKPAIVIPTALAGVIYLAVAGCRGWASIVLLIALINVLSAVQSPGFVSLTAESLPARQRGLAFAIFQLFIGVSVALGPALGGLLLPTVGARRLIVATGVTFLAVYVVRQVYLVETRPPRAARTRAPRAAAPMDKRTLIALLAFGSAVTSVPALTIWGPFIPMFAADVAHLTPAEISYAFAIAPLPAVIISVWLGRLVDVWGAPRVVALGSVGHIVAMGLWVMVRGLWSAVAVLLLAYTTYQLAVIAYDTLRSSLPGDEARARVLGTLGAVTGVVSGLAPVAGGLLMSAFGPAAPYGLATVACVATLPLLRAVSLARPTPVTAAAPAGPAAGGGEEG